LPAGYFRFGSKRVKAVDFGDLAAFRVIWATFHCACAETAIYELPVKILTPAFYCLTPISLYRAICRRSRTFLVDFYWISWNSAIFVRLVNWRTGLESVLYGATWTTIIAAQRYACAVYAVIVYQSVCPSMTSRSSTKTAKPRITPITPDDRVRSFWCQRSRRNFNGFGSSPTGAPNRDGIKIGDFRSTSRYISETVQDKDYRTLIRTCVRFIEWCYFQWPRVTLTTPKPSRFRHFLSPFLSS